jgi:hypothetical protein
LHTVICHLQFKKVKEMPDLRTPVPVIPLPGETLFSLFGRWFNLTGMASAAMFMRSVNGGYRRTLSLGLPGRLDWLARNLPSLSPVDANELVERFTIAPLYRPFLQQGQWLQIVEQLKGFGSRDARMLMGLARGGGEQRFPLHCRVCLRVQTLEFGHPFWTMGFVLPHVTVCPIHGVDLEQLRAAPSRRLGAYEILSPPYLGPANNGAMEGATDPHQLAQRHRLSQLTTDLFASGLPPIDHGRLRATYLWRLKELGLLDAGGRVKRRALFGELKRCWGDTERLRCTRGREVPAWLAPIYSDGKTAVRSPLPHLLLIGALFRDVGTWVAALAADHEKSDSEEKRSCQPPMVGTRLVRLEPWISLSAKAPRGLTIDTDSRALLRAGLSVRAVSLRTGKSIASLYRGLHKAPELAREWALAALSKSRALAKSASTDARLKRGNAHESAKLRAATKWLYRHRATFEAVAEEL